MQLHVIVRGIKSSPAIVGLLHLPSSLWALAERCKRIVRMHSSKKRSHALGEDALEGADALAGADAF